jgi:hypothetical protein
MEMSRSTGEKGASPRRADTRRVTRVAALVFPALVAAFAAALVIEGGRYPAETLLSFAVGITGIAYSMRAIASRTEMQDGVETAREVSVSGLPMDLGVQIGKFKAVRRRIVQGGVSPGCG